jgi:IS605 OrfB family transposase
MLCYNMAMKLTAKVKLQPTPEQQQALLETLEQANAASNYISDVAWQNCRFNQFGIHKLTYFDVKTQFGLTAQVVVRCISKVADAYKLDKETQRIFKPHGSIAYDSRILRWYVEKQEVSIWTTQGRQRIPFLAGQRQLELLKAQRGESDLVLVDGRFYLFATCEIDIPDPQDVQEFLGVDLGIVNIATTSDGENYASNHLNSLRNRHARLRKKLQAKGTQAAHRLLKKRHRKEQRMAKHVNHEISKRLVVKAKDTGRGIALENLTGIRERTTARKANRRQHASWSFFDLRQKIEYKARLNGVLVVSVDPRNTSRTCPACGSIDKRNRPTQSQFSCVSCGFAGFADHIAAINIGRRAASKPTMLPGCVSPKRDTAPGGSSPL